MTPLEIENKRFSKQIVNGYNVEEVDEFLDELTEAYENLYKEVPKLKTKIADLEKNSLKYKTIEDTLQNTLIMAQTTAEDVKKVANQQAEQIINEAKVIAQRKAEELNIQVIDKNKELSEMKKHFEIYKAKMESLLIAQLELIKDMGRDD